MTYNFDEMIERIKKQKKKKVLLISNYPTLQKFRMELLIKF